mmetsp:Transcript_61817/g.99973  ORF Transcript_61817/g.99973 Transcript_61817/m.99973 type:complete len:92 (+) Transcript_61817:112-387(+)
MVDGDSPGSSKDQPADEKSGTRVCTEGVLDACALLTRGVVATGSAVVTAVQYTAYPIKEAVIGSIDSTNEYFQPYLKKQAVKDVPTFRYGT